MAGRRAGLGALEGLLALYRAQGATRRMVAMVRAFDHAAFRSNDGPALKLAIDTPAEGNR